MASSARVKPRSRRLCRNTAVTARPRSSRALTTRRGRPGVDTAMSLASKFLLLPRSMMNSDGGEAAVANAELISELVRAHYAGDQRRFGNLLNQFIASESRAGHVHLAQRLRDVRTEAEAAPAPAAKPAQLARAPRDLEHILSVGYSDVRLSDLVLSEGNRKT